MGVPLVPYIELPELVLVPRDFFGAGLPPAAFSIKPFGTLVATGVYLGSYLAIRQARKLRLDERVLTSFIVWVVGIGFVGGHVLDVIFYYPGRLREDPLAILRLWDGLSSFGGFTGALIGALLFRWRHRVSILPYADLVASALPVGWVFGRMGCSVAHDHPGIASQAWFAVRYPGGGRFDLGLYEMLLTIPIALAFLYLRRQPRPVGFYCALLCISYAPLRFALDFLREREPVRAASGLVASVDPRYFGLTPAQWACFALFALGVVLLVRTGRTAGAPAVSAAGALVVSNAGTPPVTPGS